MPDYAPLPIDSIHSPATQEELVNVVRGAYEAERALYPIGGGTSLDYGLAPKPSGLGVVLTGLNAIVDFPARDLTVTVEAGVRLAALDAVLATENLCLPVDVPRRAEATLGGVIATATSGPRRFGYGSIRDFVIGIQAVDGRGEVFHGGGRVVKNVAGYDFCKLLTGSLGTLGVISQVTLKLRPIPRVSRLLACRLPSLAAADEHLAALASSDIRPAAIELLLGPAWQGEVGLGEHVPHEGQPTLVVGLEGTEPEVAWMASQLQADWNSAGLAGGASNLAWQTLADFPAQPAPLVLKASVKPSFVARFIAEVLKIDPQASVQAHAGNGIVLVRCNEFPKQGLSRTVVGQLQPLAAQAQGTVVVLSNSGGSESTIQSTFGALGPQLALMNAVKQQFDPRGILNPGRYVYA